MTTKNAAVLIVLYFVDLREGAKSKEFVKLSDFKPEVQDACQRDDLDILIYEDQDKVRKILAYNDNLDTDAQPSYETVEDVVDNWDYPQL
jgi:hypothetical protein